MKKLENHKNYNCKVTTEDGEEFLIHANYLKENDLDQWKGWHCEAGYTQVMINVDLEVYGGECKNDYLGSALDKISLLPTATICKLEKCSGCTADLLRDKYI